MKKAEERCFGTGKDFYETYHDNEWGVPVHDDRHLFEMLCLEGQQAGLSWETILRKRENYRRLFHNFDPQTVANMKEQELEDVRMNPAIIRNRLKIASIRKNARVCLEIQREFGSLDSFLWGFVNHTPILNRWKSMEEVPSSSPTSDALAKELKKRGMTFVGTKIIYSFMQAVGMINDHLMGCPCRT